jgi:hypothetical protein
MNALDILKRCRAAGDEIERLQQRIEQRREVLTGISAPQADPNGGSRGSADPDKYGRVMGEIDELERKLEARREAENVEKVAAVSLLDMLPQLESKILHLYYVKKKDTTEIARTEKYQTGYVRKKKREAEQLLDMLSPERVRGTLPAWYIKETEDRK